MVWQPYPSFHEPQQDAAVWRYIDLPKLIDLLHRKALYFTSIEELRRGDRFEGLIDDSDYLRFAEETSRKFNKPPEEAEQYKATVAKNIKHTFASNGQLLVNCWHLAESESMAMWKIYSPQGTGVALVSTFKMLKDAFRRTANPIRIGLVEYQSKLERRVPLTSAFSPALVKRDAFVHEHELRAIVWNKEGGLDPRTGTVRRWIESDDPMVGIHIRVELDFIDHIRVPPASPPWYADVVRATVKAFGLNVQIKRSDLD